MEQKQTERTAELRVTSVEARGVANLLRYTIGLNTTVGLVTPTERRLTTPAHRAVEIAALILEGKTFEEAAREAASAWTGSLEEEHRHALDLVRSTRDMLQNPATTGLTSPELLAEYLEISQKQFLELITPPSLAQKE